MATQSSILAWRIPWTEEAGRLQSVGLQRVGHDGGDLACTYISIAGDTGSISGWGTPVLSLVGEQSLNPSSYMVWQKQNQKSLQSDHQYGYFGDFSWSPSG